VKGLRALPGAAARWALLLLAGCATKGAAPDAPEAPPPPPKLPVEVEGATRVPAETLLAYADRELKAFQERHRPAEASDAAYVMEVYLRNEGYAHARVDFALDAERLLFRVDDGPRTHVRWLLFEGAKAFTKEEFADLFAFAGAGPLGSGQSLYVRAQVEGGVQKLERFYHLRGYLRARVSIARVDWTDDRSQADITIVVEEGIRYDVSAVEFEGMEPVDLGLVGKPYHVRLPVQEAARLRRILLDEGRQRCSVHYDTRIDDATGAVVVRFTVDRGPVVRVGTVKFEGNERTKKAFLRRRAAMEEGDKLVQEMIDKATTTLYRTGLFSLVRPRLEAGEGETSDVTFELKELLARSVDFEVGYGSYELVRGAVRYTDRNFLGIGRTLTTAVTGSVRSWGVELGITDPYLLGEKNQLEFETGFLHRQEPSFDLESYNASVVVRREISRIWSAHVGYSIRDERATNVKVPIDEEAEGYIRTAGIVFGLTRDKRDSPFLPTTGSIADAQLLWSSPSLGADLDFLELEARWGRFFRLRPGTVLGIGASFRARYILDDRTDLPIQERYFLGGATTVRSFYEDELGPVENGSPRGGLTSIDAGMELRQRIRGDFHAAAFFDYGTIDREGFSFHGAPGYAIGLGVRYYLPVGPIRLDVGYNPGRRYAADARWAILLAIGFSF
jgi:outer membrane protein assembly complex protein YaeT